MSAEGISSSPKKISGVEQLAVPKSWSELRSVLGCANYFRSLPNLVGILERLAGHKYYAKFDLRRGYHQLLVDPKDRHLTAFVCESGVYEFVRLPFGRAGGFGPCFM